VNEEKKFQEIKARKPKRLNLWAGPGTGKSTIAAGLFTQLKMLGINVELVTEYAKDATWERRGSKVFQAQEYLFGKQHFRLFRMHDEVDFIITDSPILMSDVYTPENYALPSLRQVFREAHNAADNLDIFLIRNKPYNPAGRNQTEDEAKAIDEKILDLLQDAAPDFVVMEYSRAVVDDVIQRLIEREWIPAITDAQQSELVNYHSAMADYYKQIK
jgi:hypothetical protein